MSRGTPNIAGPISGSFNPCHRISFSVHYFFVPHCGHNDQLTRILETEYKSDEYNTKRINGRKTDCWAKLK